MAGLLSGITVISLAQQYPGPYCTMLLSDLGADVVLVEQPDGGDPARGADGLGSFFSALNRGKRSITLNLKNDDGIAIFWELLETADVVVEGFRPGVMERLGFGQNEVRERFPQLVYCSISGFGQDGPYRSRAGHDLSYQALAGLLASSIETDARNYSSPLAIGDLSSAMFATVGIVGALLHRERSGTGEYVDVSMSDGLLSWMGTSLEPVLNGVEQRAGSREPAYGVFLCGDGKYISLSIAHEDHFWRPLCEQLGRPDLSELRGGERRARRDELREIIADRLAHDSRDHWVELLAAANVATGPVLSLSEVVEDPHNRAREMFVSGGDGSDRQWYVAHPLKFAETQAREPSPAPQLGQHTDVILRELGHGGADIERLREGGAL